MHTFVLPTPLLKYNIFVTPGTFPLSLLSQLIPQRQIVSDFYHRGISFAFCRTSYKWNNFLESYQFLSASVLSFYY